MLKDILDRAEAAIRKYCILPNEHAYVAAVLWVCATHLAEIADIATRVCITAPERRCGKSRLLKVLMCLVWEAESLVDTTKAALVDAIGQGGGVTIVADEADQWLPKGGPLVGIVNAGHERGNYRTIMVDGHRQKQETFVFAALAGIGAFPDTIADRAIMFHMQRRAPGEKVDPFRLRRDQIPLKELGAELHEALHERMADIRVISPDNPLEDRAADNWELLLMIAEAATDPNQMNNPASWAYRAREAAIALTDEAEAMQEETRGQKLLIILRSMFKRTVDGKIKSADIIATLAKDPQTWPDFGTAQLSAMLEPYGVKSTAIKFKDGTFRGYRASMFPDVFARYLPAEDKEDVLKAV